MKTATLVFVGLTVLFSISHRTAAQVQKAAAPADSLPVPHFAISHDPGISPENVRSVADELELIAGAFNEKAALQLKKPVPVLILTSMRDLKLRATGLSPDQPVVYVHDSLMIVSWNDAGFQLDRILPSIKFATVYAILDVNAAHGAPRWLMYGYALRFSGLASNLTPPPVAYMRSFDDFGEEVGQTYNPSQAGDYNYLLQKTIDFLAARYGERKFVSLFMVMSADKTLSSAFETVFGEKYDVTEKAWRAYIDTQVGNPRTKKNEQNR